MDYEIIFVNDGSRDKTLEICKNLAITDASVIVIDFTRNFGHEIAMTAGLDHAIGDAVLFMDADLQHPPSLIPDMVRYWHEDGHELVLTKIKKNAQKTFFRKMIVKAYYQVLNFLSSTEITESSPDFRLISRRYADMLKQMNEQERMFRGMLSWIGTSEAKVIEFDAPKRFAGTTHYNFKASMKLAVNSILQFSIKPLRVATYLGLMSAFISTLFGAFTIFEHLYYKMPSTGYATLVIIMVFTASIQLIVLGIIGEYIGRIHLEVKRRPLYLSKIISGKKRDS
jgi:dolichol-phosphate mannosyltransferase